MAALLTQARSRPLLGHRPGFVQDLDVADVAGHGRPVNAAQSFFQGGTVPVDADYGPSRARHLRHGLSPDPVGGAGHHEHRLLLSIIVCQVRLPPQRPGNATSVSRYGRPASTSGAVPIGELEPGTNTCSHGSPEPVPGTFRHTRCHFGHFRRRRAVLSGPGGGSSRNKSGLIVRPYAAAFLKVPRNYAERWGRPRLSLPASSGAMTAGAMLVQFTYDETERPKTTQNH